MEVIYILTTCAFFIWEIINIVSWALLWQRREYNWKRLYSYLTNTKEGRKNIFSPLSLIKWTTVIFYFYTIFEEQHTSALHFTIFILFIIQLFFIIRDILRSQKKKPVFTAESYIIISLSFLVIFIIYSFPLLDSYFWLVFIDRITVLIVTFLVFIVSFPLELLSDKKIEKAMKKIKSHKSIVTIGIVGDYGKSATKHFLMHLLNDNYNVVASNDNEKNIESIAKVINKSVGTKTQIFIADINDYSVGDVKSITKMIKPTIGIITGIHHKDHKTFKSLEESIISKSEIISELNSRGFTLFNGDDTEVLKLHRSIKKSKVLYSTKDTPSNRGEFIRAADVRINKYNLAFDILIRNKKIHMVVPVVSRYFLENILPAIYLANYLGMNELEIKKKLSTLITHKGIMDPRIHQSGMIILDNTENKKVNALKHALEYMSLYKKKKYIVLGEIPENRLDEIGNSCDMLYIVKSSSEMKFKKKIANNNIMFISEVKISEQLEKVAKSGDIVYIEGDKAAGVLKNLNIRTDTFLPNLND